MGAKSIIQFDSSMVNIDRLANYMVNNASENKKNGKVIKPTILTLHHHSTNFCMRIFRDRGSVSFRYFWLSVIAIFIFMSLPGAYHVFRGELRASESVHWILLGAAALSLGLLAFLLHNIRKINQQLQNSEELFRVVFDNTAVGLVHVDQFGRMLHANEAFCKMLGYSHVEVMAPEFQFADIFYSETARNKLFGEAMLDCSHDNRCVLVEPCRGKRDKLVWMNLYVELITGSSVNAQTYIIATVDVTRQRRVAGELAAYRENLEKIVDERTLELKESEKRFRFIAEHNHDVIWIMDLKSQKLTYVSPAVLRMRGVSPEEAMHQSPWISFSESSRSQVQGLLEEVLHSWDKHQLKELSRTIEAKQVHRDGHEIDVELVVSIHPDEHGHPASILGVTHDITQRKRTEAELRYLAFHDGLTKLPNRRLLYDRLRQAIRHARRKRRRIAVLFIDLDKFKPVNDELGHQVGDWLLGQVAQRMLEILRAYDTAARMGGDEFVVLLPELDDVADAVVIAERIRLAMDRPFKTEAGTTLRISCSIGVALFPDHADNEHELMRIGDDAMYQAKRSGRNRVEMLTYPEFSSESVSWAPPVDDAPLVLSWSNGFECGDPLLDAEHQNLFELANYVIRSAMVRGAQPEQFNGALNSLLVDISEHFAHEENILHQQEWPHLAEHVVKHRNLLNRAGELRRAAEKDELPISALVDFLAVEVVAQHILTDDRQYFSCFRAN